MQVQRGLLLILTFSLFVTGVTVFVHGHFAHDANLRGRVVQSDIRQTASTSRTLLTYDDGLEFERRVVTDVPFSATSIVELDQRLPDGSVSTKTSTTLIFRDRKGRTRRDLMTEGVSVITASPLTPTRSIINDPVSGFTYNLEARTGVAQRKIFASVPQRDLGVGQITESQKKGRNQILPMSSSTDGKLVLGASAVESKSVQLAVREIEGVLAEGMRVSITVPAGAVGNEQPVEIVAERWYAPSIQAVILVKRTDPIAGDSIYRLTNITRSEPAEAVFAVPSNYKIRDESGKEVSNSRKNN